MHIMEVVTAGLLFLVALNLVSTMMVEPRAPSEHLEQVRALGADVLRVLDEREPASDHYSSALDEGIVTDNVTVLREQIDNSLPESISYTLTLAAIDSSFRPYDPGTADVDHGVLVAADTTALELISYGDTGDQAGTCHRLVYLHNGRVHDNAGNQYTIDEGWYDLLLVLWFEPRGDM